MSDRPDQPDPRRAPGLADRVDPLHDLQPPRGSVFLRRASYRRRRLSDAARLLPIFGLGLFFLPLLWPSDPTAPDAVPMSTAVSYVFASWAVLIVIVAVFGWLVRHTDQRYRPDEETSDRPEPSDYPPSKQVSSKQAPAKPERGV